MRPTAEWVALLNDAGVPCGPINSIDETFADPQVRHLAMAAPVDHPLMGKFDVLGQGANLSRTPFHIHSAPPDQGEHTDAILGELGYDAAAIAALRDDGVI